MQSSSQKIKPIYNLRSISNYGAHNWTRTSDLSLTKGVLYRLSYVGQFLPPVIPSKLERVMGFEPTSSAWKAEVLPLNYTRPDKRPG